MKSLVFIFLATPFFSSSQISFDSLDREANRFDTLNTSQQLMKIIQWFNAKYEVNRKRIYNDSISADRARVKDSIRTALALVVIKNDTAKFSGNGTKLDFQKLYNLFPNTELWQQHNGLWYFDNSQPVDRQAIFINFYLKLKRLNLQAQ